MDTIIIKGKMSGFMDFIREQGVVGLAIGFVLGGAVGKTVSSLVDNVISPLIGLLMGKVNLVDKMTVIGTATLKWGAFISTIIDFLIVAAVVYFGFKALGLDKLDKEERVGAILQFMQPLSWSVREYEEKERHPDWLWYAGLIFGIAATVSFFYGNIFFGIFLVIAGVSVIIFATRPPQLITVSFHEKELVVDTDHIAYERIKQFWIDETEKPDKLVLLVKGSFIPMLVIPLAGVTAESVRTEMLKHAPQVEMRESLGIKIAERLGF